MEPILIVTNEIGLNQVCVTIATLHAFLSHLFYYNVRINYHNSIFVDQILCCLCNV